MQMENTLLIANKLNLNLNVEKTAILSFDNWDHIRRLFM